jgi:hypothetical protein
MTKPNFRKVFTFYAPVEGKHEQEELDLIHLWKTSWSEAGWEPVVLGQGSFVYDPESLDILDRVRRLPSINRKFLDYWCYARWLAVAQQGGGFMSDYDVINYSFAPTDYGLLQTYDHHVPCLASGDESEFRKALGWFLRHRTTLLQRITGQMHASDMVILQKHRDEFVQSTICREYGQPGWETAAVVHYSNHSMKPHGYVPRHTWIPKLRPLEGRPAGEAKSA